MFDKVLLELRGGRKTSHWMWFIFPQMRGLGHSPMATQFALASQEEATAYVNHPLLGPRLRECTRLVNLIQDKSIEEILGYPDNLKFRSSMTLFARATPDNQVFIDALSKFFDGKPDPLTLDLLG